MSDYSIELINEQKKLIRLVETLAATPVIALDIETINWWNRHQERIALIQIAFRTTRQPKVVIIDALANLDLKPLRLPLELETTTKVIHNAVFDATRLANHLRFKAEPIFDTMIAARRNGERQYSLKAQAQNHLNLQLDKAAQGSDWSRRPLDTKQVYYAALDAFATLRLYEDQIKRKLNGAFRLKEAITSKQRSLPLTGKTKSNIYSENIDVKPASQQKNFRLKTNLSALAIALLGVITELPTRYHPDQLAVSLGIDRVGMTGWIVDCILGSDADLEESSVKLEIVALCEQKLIRITETRRLESTAKGADLWRQSKSI